MQRDHEEFEFPREEDWLELEPESVSADFVDRTLRRVLADRGPGDAIDLPPEILQAYAPPEPGPGFVDRVLAAVGRQRPLDLQRILQAYQAPEPTQDFVARTLRALQAGQPQPVASRRLLSGPWAAVLLAAAIVIATLLLWPRGGSAPEIGPRAAVIAAWSPLEAPRYTPDPTGALFARSLHAADPMALPEVYHDPLLAMAREGDE